MTMLEEMRHRADMLQVYVDRDSWFRISTKGAARTRQALGQMNLVKPRTRMEVKNNFFSIRVVKDWNILPEDIKMARSAGNFKCLYNQQWRPQPPGEKCE